MSLIAASTPSPSSECNLETHLSCLEGRKGVREDRNGFDPNGDKAVLPVSLTNEIDFDRTVL